MNNEQISSVVKDLHKEIWKHKDILWPGEQLAPLQMLNPMAATQILGITYIEVDDLGCGHYQFGRSNMLVAGLLDRQSRKIAVATRFGKECGRFTAAHEIGHWLLHPNEKAHRDRSINGSIMSAGNRPPMEREADYFSASFYMPERLLMTKFEDIFGKQSFIFDEAAASALKISSSDLEAHLFPDKNSLEREFALARCTSYKGRHFYSLAEQFGVSAAAMAIRIKEFGLIRWP